MSDLIKIIITQDNAQFHVNKQPLSQIRYNNNLCPSKTLGHMQIHPFDMPKKTAFRNQNKRSLFVFVVNPLTRSTWH